MPQLAGQVDLKSDQPFGGASNCHLEARDNSVLDKEVKFDTSTHHLHGLLELVHVNPTKTVSLGGHRYFVSIVDDYCRHY